MADQNTNGTVEEGINGGAPFTPPTGDMRIDNPLDPMAATDPNIGQPTAQPGAQGQRNAPNFMEIMRKAYIATAMSKDGAEYVKELTSVVDTYNKGNRQRTNIVPLSYPSETQALVNGDDAFLLIFSETNQQTDNLPTVAVERAALQSLKGKLGAKIRMKNAIVITPEDYSKAAVMGSSLVNSFMSFGDQMARAMTVDSLASNVIDVTTNPDVYDNFNRKFNPHGVSERADLKITIAINVPKQHGNNTNQQTLFDLADTDRIEIGTVGAYVVFNQMNTNVYGQVVPIAVPDENALMNGFAQPAFIPEVHISAITTILPLPDLIPLMISVATTVLITNGHWKSQFANVGSAEGIPNIGNLVVNSNTGQPLDITNLGMRDTFISKMCTDPYLVIDVTEGRYRIPGLELYSLPEPAAWNKIVNDLNRFFTTTRTQDGTPVITDPFNINAGMPPTSLLYNNYTGYVKALGSNYVDSRWCSFLNIVAMFPQMDGIARNLLVHYGKEEERVKLLRQFFPDMVLHYVNHCVMLNYEVLAKIQKNVNSNLRVQTGNTASGWIDMSPLAAAARAFAQSSTQQYFMSTTNPFNQIYTTTSLF